MTENKEMKQLIKKQSEEHTAKIDSILNELKKK